MFFSGDFEVKETNSGFIISVIGGDNKVRITKKNVERVFSDEDPEMVATLLGVIELSRHSESVYRNTSLKYTPKMMIDQENFLEKLNFLLECKMLSIDALIDKFSQMKYFQVVEFFEEEFTEDFLEEISSYN